MFASSSCLLSHIIGKNIDSLLYFAEVEWKVVINMDHGSRCYDQSSSYYYWKRHWLHQRKFLKSWKKFIIWCWCYLKCGNWVKLIGSASSCCNSIFLRRKCFTSSLFRNLRENLQQIPFDFDEDSITDGSSSQEYSRLNNQTTQSTATSASKPFPEWKFV